MSWSCGLKPLNPRIAMVYCQPPHRSPATETPVLGEIIAEAVLNAETCHSHGRFFVPTARAPLVPPATE
ncbi:MAG: hypothetical protein J6386_19800 [Candidatus Synoicihabitans palmerolidicus]|nr:hypothetical protein [Candidatus Synoicihabitans palmerolidicus]